MSRGEYPATRMRRNRMKAFSRRLFAENSISIDYLSRLNERYEAWISTYDRGKLLVIDIDNNSFNENKEDLGKIINNIDAELHGLFIDK